MVLPQIGRVQRWLIRTTQLVLLFIALILLSTLQNPEQTMMQLGLDPDGQGLPRVQIFLAVLMVLLLWWLWQVRQVIAISNRVYQHVQQYATGYDVLMRSVRGESQLDSAEQIKTWGSLARFVTKMAEVALQDQSKLTESKYALGEERLQRAIEQRQANYIAGGASRILHDGKDVYNDIVDSLEQLSRSLPPETGRLEQQRIQTLLARLFRLMHLQLNYHPGEVVRKGFDDNVSGFDLRQTLLSCYLERCWRFFDTDEHADLPRQMDCPLHAPVLFWQVHDLRLALQPVPELQGYADDIWLAADNILFNAIDAVARIPREHQQPYLQEGVIIPSLAMSLSRKPGANQTMVEIRLRNRGSHIPEALLNQGAIWDLRQGYDKQGKSHRGRGIGMYTIKQIIDVGYGGQVAISNQHNLASEFHLTLFQGRKKVKLKVNLLFDDEGQIQASVNGGKPSGSQTLSALISEEKIEKVEYELKNSSQSQTISPDKSGIYYDPVDELMPSWALCQQDDVLKFMALDVRGVEVSLCLPEHKFVTPL